MYSIRDIRARQIFDSRGSPTVECQLKTVFGVFVDSVPSGASTGQREAKELRDGEKKFNGLGVNKSVRNINEIFLTALKGKDCRNQREIDNILINEDGTKNKSKYGANSTLAVSLAAARAGTIASKKSEIWEYITDLSKKEACLPVPVLNVINGGKHAGNKLDFQEYQIIPIKFKTFESAFCAGVEVYQELKKDLEKNYGKSAINVGDEGGFAPNFSKVEEPLDVISKALETLGYSTEFGIGIDVAASSFSKYQDDGKITYVVEGKTLTKEQLLTEYEELIKSYNIVSIEDPFDENDLTGWGEMFSVLGKRIQILADDLTVSQIEYIENAVNKKLANALLLKPNQVGTVSEAINSALFAFSSDWQVQVSHRSGETNSSFISDLAVGLGATQIKSGAPARGERLAKYNRLLKIELNSDLKFVGKKAFPKMK